MPKLPVFRSGMIHVCKRMCDTCIFRAGNLMQLRPGRVDEMVAAAIEHQSCITCHKTLGGGEAVCRGFFDKHKTVPLQLAESMRLLKWSEVTL